MKHTHNEVRMTVQQKKRRRKRISITFFRCLVSIVFFNEIFLLRVTIVVYWNFSISPVFRKHCEEETIEAQCNVINAQNLLSKLSNTLNLHINALHVRSN